MDSFGKALDLVHFVAVSTGQSDARLQSVSAIAMSSCATHALPAGQRGLA